LLLVKPQSVGMIASTRLKRSGVRALVPTAAVLLLSLLIWPAWPMHFHGNTSAPWNVSSWWPWLVPVGLAMLAWAWRHDDDSIAGASTPLLVPYCATYSLVATMTLLAGRHRKALAIVWVTAWTYVLLRM
jgi:hypothetical protein